jgi:hypothetical protein
MNYAILSLLELVPFQGCEYQSEELLVHFHPLQTWSHLYAVATNIIIRLHRNLK